MAELLSEMGRPEPILGKTYMADGWYYYDLPKMLPEYKDLLETLLQGEDDEPQYIWLTEAKYGDGFVRGQIIFSPKAMENLRKHTVKKEKV